MQINNLKKQSGTVPVINPEGGKVLQDNLTRRLLLSALALNTRRSRSFYHSDEEAFQEFLGHTREALEKDRLFTLAAAVYLSRKGRRLAPVIALTEAVMAGDQNEVQRELLKKAIQPVFGDRPDKILTSLAHFQNEKNVSFKALPPFFKRSLGRTLAGFKPLTLKKFRAERRAVSLADAIKALRPKPANQEMAEFYRAVIERRKEAKLEATEHISATLSSTELSREQKEQVIRDNLETMPLKALITNIRQYAEMDGDVQRRLQKRFGSLLANFDDAKVQKIFNICDLFIPKEALVTEQLAGTVNRIVDKAVEKYAYVFDPKKQYTLLQDLSGSMYGGGRFSIANPRIAESARMLAVLYALVPSEQIKVICFDTKAVEMTTDFASIADKCKGQPLELFDRFYRLMSGPLQEEFCGGTSIVDTYLQNVTGAEDVVILNTDEITWADNSPVEAIQQHIRKLNALTDSVILNVAYTDGKVIADKKVIRIAGLDRFSFEMIGIFQGDINRIRQEIIRAFTG
jgi:hypothetical protein